MRQLIITYTMHRQDETADGSIRLTLPPELANILLSGNTFPALELVLHLLADLQGYDEVNPYGLSVELLD